MLKVLLRINSRLGRCFFQAADQNNISYWNAVGKWIIYWPEHSYPSCSSCKEVAQMLKSRGYHSIPDSGQTIEQCLHTWQVCANSTLGHTTPAKRCHTSECLDPGHEDSHPNGSQQQQQQKQAQVPQPHERLHKHLFLCNLSAGPRCSHERTTALQTYPTFLCQPPHPLLK